MSFLANYLAFNEGNECPENYHIWSALTLLSAVVSRKVSLNWGQQRLYPNLYVCLVGRQGSRKGVARNLVRDLLVDQFPLIPRAGSVTSREQITKEMASESCTRVYTDHTGELIEVHPYFIVANELKNFLSVNPRGMIEFLTDVYDEEFFDARFKKDKTPDLIPRPYVVFLACETPDWITENLKTDIVSGGFARRVIMVFEKKKRCSIPVPFITDQGKKIKSLVIQTLHDVQKISGEFSWHEEALAFYNNWYTTIKDPSEPMMEGFYSSKHTQAIKVAMLLTMADYKDLQLRRETVEVAIALLDRIEPTMAELYASSGQNVLAQPTSRLLRIIEDAGGCLSEKEFYLQATRDMNLMETKMVIEQLIRSEVVKIGDLVGGDGTKRRVLMLRQAARKIEVELARKKADSSSSSPSLLPGTPLVLGSSSSTDLSSAPPAKSGE